MRTISVRLLVVLGLIGLGISGSQAFAQNEVLPASVSGPSGPKIPWPHPFLLAGLGVNGAGYSSLSGNVGGGLRIDTTHLIWTASAGYDTARKANDNTVDNVSGHSRSLDSSFYYRFQNGWFAAAARVGLSYRRPTTASKRFARRSVVARTTFTTSVRPKIA
jgi:hypothetical protein